jgi:Flp pilus assembly protein TadD
MLLRQGDTAEGRRHLERSVRLFQETGVESSKAAVLLSLCELAIADADTNDATRLAQEALELATRLGEGATIASAHMWLGRIAAGHGDHGTADSEFSSAFDVLERVGGSHAWVSNAHTEYGKVLEARGDLHGAIKHLKEALALRPSRKPADSMEVTA